MYLTNNAINIGNSKTLPLLEDGTPAQIPFSELLEIFGQHGEYFDGAVANMSAAERQEFLRRSISDSLQRVFLALNDAMLDESNMHLDMEQFRQNENRFFSLLAADVALTRSGKASIYEVNTWPSLKYYSHNEQ